MATAPGKRANRGSLVSPENWPVWGRLLLVACVLGLAGYLFSRAMADYTLDDILGAVRAVPMHRFALAIACAAGSYFCLTWFDWLAVRYAGKPLAYPRTALASFTSLSLGHNIGFAALSSGAVRYRFYSRWGLSVEQVAKVILFCGVTVALGLMVAGGGALLLRPRLAERMTGIGPEAVSALGIACLGLAGAYVLLACFLRGTVKLWNWRFEMPTGLLAAGQVVAGTANYIFVSACLYQGMAGLGDIPFPAAVAAFVTANTAALVSHVPGGVGIIESVVLLMLPQAQVLGALVVFRTAYYLIPLVLGGGTFLLVEALQGAGNRR